MGGQACVLYGAAEFSRDTDVVILADHENLKCLQSAVVELDAKRIAVPPFDLKYLDMGLAVHFRCHASEARGIRLDVMSKLRGVRPFPELWQRRSTFQLDDLEVEVISLPDLVQAKKTQRDKDWPMLTRLVEANYFANRESPSLAQIEFWLSELRTPVLTLAARNSLNELELALKAEENEERARDREYWAPLRRELARLRQVDRLR